MAPEWPDLYVLQVICWCVGAASTPLADGTCHTYLPAERHTNTHCNNNIAHADRTHVSNMSVKHAAICRMAVEC